MKNKNGFTLIEIIGVVTVLSIILIVAVPSLTKTLKKNQQNKYNDYIDNLKIAAENYAVDKLKNGETVDDNLIITLGDLIDVGYVKEVITNPENEKKLSRRTNIVVSKDIDGTFKYTINEFYSIPKEYQEVEYIESSGTQRILTNIIPNDKTGLKIEWLFYENLDQVVVLGTKQFWFGHQGDTLVFGWNEPIFNDVMPVETKLDVRLNYMNDRKMQYSYKEGSEVHSSSQPITKTLNNQTQSVEIFFGDVHIKLYSLVITQESQTIANLIPCYRKSDNVIGLYDLVENEFYTNSGTGTFLKGADV